MKDLTFKETWNLIEYPFYAMVAYSFIALYLPQFIAISTLSLIGWAVGIGIYTWAAHNVFYKTKSVGYAAKSGSLLGALSGFASAAISFAIFTISPDTFAPMMASLADFGITGDAAVQQFKIGMYFGLISGPIVGALMGALITAIAAWVIKITD